MSPPINVAAHLARMAAAEPDRPAVHFPTRGVKPNGPTEYATLTFAQLHADSDAVAHGLTCAGVGRGTRVALMVPPSLDFFSLTFALFKVAAVPVLIDPGMGVKNLGTCLGEAAPEAFIGVPKAHLARRVLGWGKKTIRTTINVGRGRFFCHHGIADLRASGRTLGAFPVPEVGADDTAAILFTSGSTGVAKGVVYTHGIFAAQVEMLRTTYGIEPGEIDLCTFPLFALFGPALGMTCVIPDMDATRPARIDPAKAVAQIRQFGVTNLFGSPAVIRRLGEWGRTAGESGRLTTVRRAISAGAPVPAGVIEAFTRMLPEAAQVFTPYGATESLPVANIGSREILGETRALTEQGRGVCVGRPVAGMRVEVVAISDGPIPEWDDSLCLPPGEIGEFVVRGPVVTKQYFHRPLAMKRAKIHDPKTGEILHRMGDVGYKDTCGRLWFCGRKSHRVVTPRGTLFTDQVEPVFNTLSWIFRTALVGVTRDGVTYPVVCVELLKSRPRMCEAPLDLLLLRQARRFAHTASIEWFLVHPGFPVDVRHNSKIFREELADWADKKIGKTWPWPPGKPPWTPEVIG
ncbi:fatty acid CoA ligase family protein [Fimbriiglobus ruber]|uniref:AMP-dependent synthetase/ligase in alkane synthesis cluster n=1 Tax=Fimbriiglobus ruber TaxID=1908690 RepID=A0A225E0U1_9BACT|nr:fatty acid CoA ligase family protein [Fimbriiglobus ruber]OWK42295.1 AMP-dependent synthetase/ligase in alkane synthesis cluster [Fimbriiglobus ruber]